MTLTKEWLRKTIAELEEERDAVPGVVNEDATMALAAMKLALASLEAESKPRQPELSHVIYHFRDWNEGFPIERFKADYVISWMLANYPPAQPAAVSVPDALADDIHSDDYPLLWSYNNGWNACRSAMLQGADRNSPVIPDGWALVPIEPTEDMIVNGFESEPDESFSDEKEWEAYDAMSGCQQAAHRAKLCWAAMIAAAPKI
ncbi:hypothetical protein M8U49_11880 [Enterobacter hormaechei]|uniref:hypothetical protein n=1 Tax=Enterobacter hormaechei TaxID=158836 RepID=UPI0010BF5574|nr:hypothetical protein [Enterobacter hormaechei]MCM8176751.1 hypothetical protein [Enterobacter hormaechei]QWS88749.1 hypothetical protein FCG85_012075 [Enterobacter hormaechei]